MLNSFFWRSCPHKLGQLRQKELVQHNIFPYKSNNLKYTQYSASVVKYTINNTVPVINQNNPPHCGQ